MFNSTKVVCYVVIKVLALILNCLKAEEDGANVDLDSQRKGKCAVIKTSTRQTYFLPVIGLVDAEKLEPGDLVGVNKDSYLILDTLPPEYDSRVKAMEVDERPTEQYSDIGGLDKQIQVRPAHMFAINARIYLSLKNRSYLLPI